MHRNKAIIKLIQSEIEADANNFTGAGLALLQHEKKKSSLLCFNQKFATLMKAGTIFGEDYDGDRLDKMVN